MTATQQTDDRPRAYVGAVRKDGRYPVQFVYPRAGARVTRLLSAEQVGGMRALGRYLVLQAGVSRG